MKKRTTPRRAQKRAKTHDSGRAKIYIVGESPMVEEFAELCGTYGYEIFVRWNEPPRSTPTFQSQHIRRSNSIPPKTALALELTNTDLAVKQKNIAELDSALPPTAAIVSSSITMTAMQQTTWMKHRHRLVGISALPTFSSKPLVEAAPTVFSPKETLEVVQKFFHSIGKEIALVQDRVGMVLPRILCQIINEATFALQEDVTSPKDIDIAMKLGTNYPLGPIEWAEKIGMKHVYAVLAALENDLKEERYRVSPLLKQMAQTGEWWKRNDTHSERKA